MTLCVQALAAKSGRCDYAFILSSSYMDAADLASLQHRAFGLLIEAPEASTGVTPMAHVKAVFEGWSSHRPLMVAASNPCLTAALFWATLYGRAMHILDVKACDVEMAVLAKAKGGCCNTRAL